MGKMFIAHIWAVSAQFPYFFSMFKANRKKNSYNIWSRQHASSRFRAQYDKWGMALKFHILFLHDFIFLFFLCVISFFTDLTRTVSNAVNEQQWMKKKIDILAHILVDVSHYIRLQRIKCYAPVQWIFSISLSFLFFLQKKNETVHFNTDLFDRFYTCMHNKLILPLFSKHLRFTKRGGVSDCAIIYL